MPSLVQPLAQRCRDHTLELLHYWRGAKHLTCQHVPQPLSLLAQPLGVSCQTCSVAAGKAGGFPANTSNLLGASQSSKFKEARKAPWAQQGTHNILGQPCAPKPAMSDQENYSAKVLK